MTDFKRKRIASGLTQKQLGDRLGVTYSAIGKWDRGDASPSPEFFPRLAKIFGITAEEVTHLFDPQPAQPASA